MIRKFPKLPHGYGGIRFLGTGRTKPYAVHLPEKNAKRPPTLCYVSDWFIGFAVLTAWHAGVYYPGLEDEIYRKTRPGITGNNPSELCRRIIQDYSRMNHRRHGCSVGEAPCAIPASASVPMCSRILRPIWRRGISRAASRPSRGGTELYQSTARSGRWWRA